MLKVSDCADLRVVVKDVLESKGCIAKTADFLVAGIRAVNAANLCNAGYLNRVRHGYYQMAEQSVVSEEQMLTLLNPKASYMWSQHCLIMDIAIFRPINGLLQCHAPFVIAFNIPPGWNRAVLQDGECLCG